MNKKCKSIDSNGCTMHTLENSLRCTYIQIKILNYNHIYISMKDLKKKKLEYRLPIKFLIRKLISFINLNFNKITLKQKKT